MATTEEQAERTVAAVDFLTVTEQAAIASARWLGRGDNMAADQAAVDAMRTALGEMPITGTVVIGEGQKDEAPELYVGEVLGTGGMPCEIAVDPLEGTSLVARGDSGAVAICAIGAPGGMMSAPDMYMEKLVVGATARGRVNIEAPIAETLEIVARCYGRAVRDLTTIVLDRPRHEQLIEDIRAAGARIRLIPDGDITASLSVAVRGTGDHLYVGIGGSTEGVITAAALECLGAEIQAKMWPRTDEERRKMAEFGIERPDRVLTTRDLSPAPRYVVATGVTDGGLLKGVRYFADGARTHSIVMDLVGNTVRFIDTVHLLSPTLIREIRL
jgi:fructose-1,6-bisphosphatase II